MTLRIRALHKEYRSGFLRSTTTTAIENVSLDIQRGQTLALVGESGSGKTTLARCVLGLVAPTAGEIEVAGLTITATSTPKPAELYRRVQLVFQDPYSSLNPRRTVAQTLHTPLARFGGLSRERRLARAGELLEQVHLDASFLCRYPHELSGGQRQRVGIARALAAEPEVLVLDEPTSSLDLSIRLSVIDLLLSLQHELSLSYLFISHDLSAVGYIAEHTAVMRCGRIVESGATSEILTRPREAYTRHLIASAPKPAWE